jgi:pyridoxal phosphate-dependent aminotransferase EpsN
MAKRLIDITLSLIGLMIGAPLMIIIAVLILVFEGRPVFYRGKRVGRHGGPFYMLKFRSMIRNADRMGSGAIPAADFRITPIGRLLRKTKLDELPQLYNVLKGEMSVVGPRPELWRYSHTYAGERREILSVRPGLTDLATLVDIDEGALLRSAEDPDNQYEQLIRPVKIALQIKYVRSANLWRDLQILAYTAGSLLVRKWIPAETRPYRELLEIRMANDTRGCTEIEDQTPAKKRILLSIPHMGGEERSFVEAAFETNWLSTVGPNLEFFEQEFESLVGLPAVALACGTAGIHLGLRLLGVGPGDEVFCPTLTFVATVNPVRYLGAQPVFIDSETDTWNMDPELLADALRDRFSRRKLPRAVVVADMYGQCADMDRILAACGKYHVPVLEDAAEALGSFYKGKPAGTLGDIGVYSFNGNKIITTTSGGMLVSRNRDWVRKARFWSQQARDPGLAYEHSEIGYNYRMSNVLAGIGRGQLEVLELRIQQRRAIAMAYRDAFADVPGIALMPQSPLGRHTNWLSCFLIEEELFGCSRDGLIRALDTADIESRPVWKPMHLQHLYADCDKFGGRVAEDLFRRGICLPSSSSLSPKDQLRVINAVRNAAGADPLLHLIRAASSSESRDLAVVG